MDFRSEGEETPDAVIGAMTETMALRGPDDQGVWRDRYVALGHRRLAVIDPAGGRQPMVAHTPDGPVALTYSGEVYSFVALREQLRGLGHRFATRSDTEVVLRGYLEWGDAVAERLDGMVAFALWDGRGDSRLVLVRDRLGIKPLYVYPTPGGLLFGSEPKAVFAHPGALRVLTMDGLRGMIAHTLTIDRAVWDGLEEVPPGTVITVDRSGIHRRRYWCLAATPHEHDLPKTVDTVRDLLAEIVERQLVADVPVSVLLSGGLDSSTLAALAAGLLRESGSKAQTYAVDFAEHAAGYVAELERPSRDAPFVREMVDRLGTVHRDVLLDAGAVSDPDLRARAVAAYDLPPASQDRDRSMLLLFREVSRLSTVALSGEGADEVFGGYSWRHDPQVWRAPAFPWIAGLTGYGQLRTVLRPELAAGLRMDDYLGDLYARAVGEVDRLPGDDPHAYRMRVLSHLELTCSLRALLARKDRLSMATGLEIRVPYCDHRLVAYVHSVPWAMQTFDGREKSLLRAAAADLLPASVLRRTKSAYPSLFDVDPLLAEARVLLGERTEPVFDLVDRDWLVRTTRRAPRGLGRADRNGLEDVLNLAAWMRAYTPELRV